MIIIKFHIMNKTLLII